MNLGIHLTQFIQSAATSIRLAPVTPQRFDFYVRGIPTRRSSDLSGAGITHVEQRRDDEYLTRLTKRLADSGILLSPFRACTREARSSVSALDKRIVMGTSSIFNSSHFESVLNHFQTSPDEALICRFRAFPTARTKAKINYCQVIILDQCGLSLEKLEPRAKPP